MPNNDQARLSRNPGPSWGYPFLRCADRVLPEAVYRPARALGTWVAVAAMPRQRRSSREYLATVLSRPPRTFDVFRHFFAFEEALMTRLRVANGRAFPCDYAPGGDAFREWLAHGGPMLLGTFHIGCSDLLGFLLGGHAALPVYIVRQRVQNSHDTHVLGARFGERVRFLWVNEGLEMLFALKEAAARPSVIALQCDRPEFSARNETFEFLGQRRLFPFTIYHLAVLFQRPVILSIGVPAGRYRGLIHASPRFEPQAGEAKAAALRRARGHFQAFLREVEAVLRQQPHQWFNFGPQNITA